MTGSYRPLSSVAGAEYDNNSVISARSKFWEVRWNRPKGVRDMRYIVLKL
jgi:hypothetical protein